MLKNRLRPMTKKALDRLYKDSEALAAGRPVESLKGYKTVDLRFYRTAEGARSTRAST